MLTFAAEPWEQVKREICALTPAHWDMLALHKEKIPLDPDWTLYRKLSSDGSLHVTTARTYAGVLAGYYVSVVLPHPHYKSTLFGMIDSYWISPELRDPAAGLGLFVAMEEQMRELGVRCIITTTKLHYDISPLLERCGFEPAGKTYTKSLEG